MKKIILSFFIMIITTLSSNAETIIGTALTDFSTATPKEYFAVKIDEGFTVDNFKTYNKDTIFYGKIIKVENGKRGKRMGYFVFSPTHYADAKGSYIMDKKNQQIKVSFYKPFDKEHAMKSIANTGVTTAAGQLLGIPLLSQSISFIKGVVKPEENTNRVVSGVKKVYKDSPLTLVEKGDELIIHPGQQVKLKINFDENEE